MTTPPVSIYDLLKTLVRRERALVLIRTLAEAALLCCGVVCVVVTLAYFDIARATALGAVAVLSLGSFAYWARRSLRAWAQSGRVTRQAALAEAVNPAFRGRLVLLAERSAEGRPGESEALLALAERRAAALAADLSPKEVHPPSFWRSAVWRAAIALMAVGVFQLAAPYSLQSAFARLSGSQAGAEERIAALDPDRVVLGDIVLEYRYPAYLNIDTMRIENSTGDISAPPGTRVQIWARTAESFSSARLVVSNAEGTVRTDVLIQEGRNLSSSLEVVDAGSWKIVFPTEAGERFSAEHVIALDPDLAPEVLVEAPADRLEVAFDQPLPVQWTARDDYGVVRVEAALAGSACTDAGGCDETAAGRFVLREPLDPTRQLSGAGGFTPSDLGMLPGDEGSIVIAAYDNDAVSGAKAGLSRRLQVLVLGPRGQQTRRARMIRQLRDRLLIVLADFLVEPWPVRDGNQGLARWSGTVAERMEPIEALAESYWDGFTPDTFEGTAVVEVQRTTTALLGFVIEVGKASDGGEPSRQDQATLDTLRDEVVVALEQAVLSLARVLRLQALNKVAQLTRSAAERADELAEQDASAAAARAQLDRLQRQLRQLANAVKDLGTGEMSAFIERRTKDGLALSQEVRRALAEGRVDDADVLSDRLARELGQMAQSVEDMQAAAEQEANELMQQAQDLGQALAELEEEERALAEETADLRERFGKGTSDWADQWQELIRQATALNTRMASASERVAADPRRTGGEKNRIADVVDGTMGLLDAVNARNVVTGIERAMGLERRLGGLATVLETYAMARRARGEGMVEGDVALRGDARTSIEDVRRIRRTLQSLDDDAQNLPAEALTAAQALSRQQEALRERGEGLAEEAKKIAPEFPMGAPGLEEGLNAALEEMTRAVQGLESARLVEGETAERAAADRLADARRAIERAMRDAQQMAQMSQEGAGQEQGSEEQPRGKREGPEMHAEMMEIPAPEEFQTPEAYRKALLEGMEGAVPKEFEALKRRYYEELVLQ